MIVRAERANPIPCCRISEADLRRLVTILDGFGPQYRIETERSAFSGPDWVALEPHYTPADVKLMTLSADSPDLVIRLYLNLEATPGTSENRLSIEGLSDRVNATHLQLMDIFEVRRTPVAEFFNLPAMAPLLTVGAAVAVAYLVILTGRRLRISDGTTISASLIVALVFAGSLLGTPGYKVLWPQFSIAGWGRFERWRNGVRFIVGAIVFGVVANAVWLWITSIAR